MPKLIPLYDRGRYTNSPRAGKHIADAIVDEEDFDRLSAVRWFDEVGRVQCLGVDAKALGYPSDPGMHRIIMNAPKGTDVHHVNHNHRDNRRANLVILDPLLHVRIHKQGLEVYAGATTPWPKPTPTCAPLPSAQSAP